MKNHTNTKRKKFIDDNEENAYCIKEGLPPLMNELKNLRDNKTLLEEEKLPKKRNCRRIRIEIVKNYKTIV